MNQDKNQLSYAKKGLVALLLTILCLAAGNPMAFADDRSQLKSLKPPANFDADEIDISREAVHRFDFLGVIDHISPYEPRVVVSDTSFDLAPGVRTTGLDRGMNVGLKLDSNRKVVVIERLKFMENQ